MEQFFRGVLLLSLSANCAGQSKETNAFDSAISLIEDACTKTGNGALTNVKFEQTGASTGEISWGSTGTTTADVAYVTDFYGTVLDLKSATGTLTSPQTVNFNTWKANTPSELMAHVHGSDCATVSSSSSKSWQSIVDNFISSDDGTYSFSDDVVWSDNEKTASTPTFRNVRYNQRSAQIRIVKQNGRHVPIVFAQDQAGQILAVNEYPPPCCNDGFRGPCCQGNPAQLPNCPANRDTITNPTCALDRACEAQDGKLSNNCGNWNTGTDTLQVSIPDYTTLVQACAVIAGEVSCNTQDLSSDVAASIENQGTTITALPAELASIEGTTTLVVRPSAACQAGEGATYRIYVKHDENGVEVVTMSIDKELRLPVSNVATATAYLSCEASGTTTLQRSVLDIVTMLTQAQSSVKPPEPVVVTETEFLTCESEGKTYNLGDKWSSSTNGQCVCDQGVPKCDEGTDHGTRRGLNHVEALVIALCGAGIMIVVCAFALFHFRQKQAGGSTTRKSNAGKQYVSSAGQEVELPTSSGAAV